MKSLKREAVKRDSVRALPVVVLVLVMVLAAVVAISAASPPPTLTRPEIAKIAIPEPDSLQRRDTVRFFIIVENPKNAPPNYVVVDWYQVQATDVVSSVLEIDTAKSNIVGYEGEEPVMEITDNSVVVTVDWMRPGDYFIFQIVCTLVGPLETGMVIVNQAMLDYEDSEGNEKDTIFSDPVMIPVDYYPLFLPIVAKGHAP